MKRVIVALFALPIFVAAHAQQPQQIASDNETVVNVLRQQRNEQADLVVQLAGRLAALDKQLQEAKAKAEACKPEDDKKKK